MRAQTPTARPNPDADAGHDVPEEGFVRLLRSLVRRRVSVQVPGRRHRGILLSAGPGHIALVEGGPRLAFISTRHVLAVER